MCGSPEVIICSTMTLVASGKKGFHESRQGYTPGDNTLNAMIVSRFVEKGDGAGISWSTGGKARPFHRIFTETLGSATDEFGKK
jgi:hypothetical protein